jgi:hypothetical protein
MLDKEPKLETSKPTNEAEKREPNVNEALDAAISALYFGDDADYKTYLQDVVRALDPKLADLLEDDEEAAYNEIQKRIDPNYKPMD